MSIFKYSVNFFLIVYNPKHMLTVLVIIPQIKNYMLLEMYNLHFLKL